VLKSHFARKLSAPKVFHQGFNRPVIGTHFGEPTFDVELAVLSSESSGEIRLGRNQAVPEFSMPVWKFV
jgi:hypothetical protein